MSYFQKHASRGSQVHEAQNIKPAMPTRQKKSYFNAKTQPAYQQPKNLKNKEFNQPNTFESRTSKSPLRPKQQPQVKEKEKEKEKEKAAPNLGERELPGLMLQGQNSMQELLNSSINQFTKYLSDRDPMEEQHQQLVAQNKDLRKTLDKLKMIIKQKLVSALSKQRQELNAVMEDYVRLITKLLADKEQLTAALQSLEKKLGQTERRCQALAQSERQAKGRVEELNKERQQQIAKTKHQIDDFLQIIEQYEEEAEQEGQEGEHLKRRIAELQELLAKKTQHEHPSVPPKTQALLQMLERSQEENRVLREQINQEGWSDRIAELEREHEQQFVEYERAMRQTLNKKDECIARLSSIIESYRERRYKEMNGGNISQECGSEE